MEPKVEMLRALAKLAKYVAGADIGYKFGHLTWNGINHSASDQFNAFIDNWQAMGGHLQTLSMQLASEVGYAVLTEFFTIDGLLSALILITHYAHATVEKSKRNPILPMV